MYHKIGKRIFDIVLAFGGLVVLSPVILIVAIMVRVKLGAPVIFKQKRPGFKEQIFTLYKFRTMTDEKNTKGELASDEVRLTAFGSFLRSSSLDELPELWNILKGDMSFVGPRPLLIKYLHLYNERQHKRHSVKPGLTGLAQVNGRNALGWEERFELDVLYAENLSLVKDIKIFLATIKAVVKREGISSETNVTMEAFKGNHQEEIKKP